MQCAIACHRQDYRYGICKVRNGRLRCICTNRSPNPRPPPGSPPGDRGPPGPPPRSGRALVEEEEAYDAAVPVMDDYRKDQGWVDLDEREFEYDAPEMIGPN